MRYARLPDILHTRSFRNPHALKLLYYVTMQRDYGNNTYITTYMKLAMATDMTISAVRHALKQLARDGLVIIETTRLYTYVTIPNEEENLHQITDPLISLRRHADAIERSLDAPRGSTHIFFDIFLQSQELAGKKWKDEKDLVSHFCNWYMKNAERVKRQARQREVQHMRECEAAARRQQREAQQVELAKRAEGAISYEEYKRLKAEGKI
jgi:DNA-binding transcriptional ArsR family regulator